MKSIPRTGPVRIDITDDYRINLALSRAANLAIEAGKALLKGIALLCILTGAQTLRGAAWRVAGFFVAVAVLVNLI